MMRVGVIGATGYVGAELIRAIIGHPHLELGAVVGRSTVGRRVAEIWPGLEGFVDLSVEALDASRLATLDAVFMALPHGVSTGIAAELASVPILVDLARDHRHAPGWIYGLAELEPRLAGATRIAAPGCFATAIQMALAPLARAGLLHGVVRVVAATGSTGSGASAKKATHHPERHTNLKAYKVLAHQHVPEVRATLERLGSTAEIAFVPLSAPVDRGILATCFVDISPDIDVAACLADAYASAPLVRLRDESPELRHVRGTAFCDLSVHRQGRVSVILSAIDNLGKGAATQAIQALNLQQGWAADLGLRTPPTLP